MKLQLANKQDKDVSTLLSWEDHESSPENLPWTGIQTQDHSLLEFMINPQPNPSTPGLIKLNNQENSEFLITSAISAS